MAALGNRMSEDSHPVERIFAYGFDAAGFEIERESADLTADSRLEFIPFGDPTRLDAADGVIIPQGIFEKFREIESDFWFFGTKTYVWVHRSSLLERERQVFNLLRQDKWVCFLVGEIIDSVHEGFHLLPANDTDLCKRILNALRVARHRRFNVEPKLHLKVRDDEFKPYVDHFGRPTTVFDLPHAPPLERRVIVELEDNAVGVEFDAKLFFLPFQTAAKKWPAALAVARMAGTAIREYRRNRIIRIPAWVDDLRFNSEEKLYLEINALLEKVLGLESQLASWKDYKGVLTTTGMPLRKRVIAVLESVFEFKVERDEHHRGAFIMAEDHSPLALVEVRSTEGGVARELVDEVSAIRDAQGFSVPMPILLFVNNDSSLQDLDKRRQTAIAEEVIKHAGELNILLIRTIDLVLLVKHLENDPQARARLAKLFLRGGGWLKVDLDGYRIIV